MELMDRLALFTPLDAAALALWLAAWFATGLAIEHPPAGKPSVSVLMTRFRREWMQQLAARQSRIFDSNILSTLRQGTTFFASASMIIIGGGLALIGNTERLLGIAEDLTLQDAPAVVWEFKIMALLLLVANAFLKFVWSHRLFGYCAVIMAAVPNDGSSPQALARAAQAAEININAARSFNRGMRSLYFALGGLAWLLGAVPLMVATGVTVFVLWRREFGSNSRIALLARTD
ncbi:DUF599 domain-containing protein [Rhodovulum adriaticum]|uniref:Putative membrane protein n=2 Tax=Rhodovulum adriaticum TaxID=35804 RepID=A0A4R2NN34_RHOAD|nr:DUF599 domain-containing protein [Rhodovulum adriaticum]MBK1636821.1 hypothetical protein [Rhodovulum adriaticum]TCP22708.1 putative membrane protein [Rhodovulum adriaticum]